jgi:hypothetical protein
MASLETRPGRTATSYRIVWWEDGGREQATFTNPDEAVRFCKLVEGSGNRWPDGWQKRAAVAPPRRTTALTFDAWARRAIANRSRATERTRADYLRDLDRHFADLGPKALADINDDDVTAWTAGRVATDLKPKTIRNLHGFASSLFVEALAQHPPLVDRNPFANRLPDLAAVQTEPARPATSSASRRPGDPAARSASLES